MAEAVDVYGEIVARSHAGVSRAPGERHVAHTLKRVAGEVAGRCAGPIRLAVVSAADPVDRETGRLVELPDAPFLVGALDAPAVLAELVEGPGDGRQRRQLDGARRARRTRLRLRVPRRRCRCRGGQRREVRRGHAGLAGEIAHLPTVGPGGVAMRLTDVFEALGLRRPARPRSTCRRCSVPSSPTGAVADALAKAVGGVLAAAVALADPAVVLVGGPWGRSVLAALAREFAQAPRHVPVEAAAVDDEPALAGRVRRPCSSSRRHRRRRAATSGSRVDRGSSVSDTSAERQRACLTVPSADESHRPAPAARVAFAAPSARPPIRRTAV